MRRNEFEGYVGPVYVDEDDIVRASTDGHAIGMKVVRDENGRLMHGPGPWDSTVLKVEPFPVPRLTWWQRVKRWMGW